MSGSRIEVLVTAVGGDLGQALVKSLRLGEADFEIYGCDTDAEGVGSAFVSSFAAVPAASNAATYVAAVDELCRRHGIAAIIPASVAEIVVLAQFGRLPCGAVVVCQPAEWLRVFGDKLDCMRALEQQVRLAAFADGCDQEAVWRLVDTAGFPLVVKPRRSSGSRAIRVVRTTDELARAIAETPASVVQEFIDDREGEFSVGVFASHEFTDTLAFRRELGQVGCSWFAETSYDPAVLGYALQVAKASGLSGSANVQLRKNDGVVRLLEVNPRFSSLVGARALCGFRDAEWSVQMALGHPVSAPPRQYAKIKFRRFFHELVDSGDGYRAIAEWAPAVQKKDKC